MDEKINELPAVLNVDGLWNIKRRQGEVRTKKNEKNNYFNIELVAFLFGCFWLCIIGIGLLTLYYGSVGE